MARRPQARARGHEWGEQGVVGEMGVHGAWVAVQVQQAAGALDGRLRVGDVVEVQCTRDLPVRRRQRDDTGAARQPQGAAVARAVAVLHTRDGADGEEPEQVGGLERLAGGKPQRHRAVLLPVRPPGRPQVAR